MESSTEPQSSAISEHSALKGTPEAIAEWLTLCLGDSPVSPSPSRESEQEKTTHATCGLQRSIPFGQFGPDGVFSKTCRDLFQADTLERSSVDWPRSGSMRSGRCWGRTIAAPPIAASASGSWPTPTAGEHTRNKSASPGSAIRYTLVGMARYGKWPTPSVCGNYNRKGASAKSGDGLATAVHGGTKIRQTYRTPCARDAEHRGPDKKNPDSVKDQVGGPLNPPWVEWLMGWPEGSSDFEPLGTGKFRLWLQQHSGF